MVEDRGAPRARSVAQVLHDAPCARAASRESRRSRCSAASRPSSSCVQTTSVTERVALVAPLDLPAGVAPHPGEFARRRRRRSGTDSRRRGSPCRRSGSRDRAGRSRRRTAPAAVRCRSADRGIGPGLYHRGPRFRAQPRACSSPIGMPGRRRTTRRDRSAATKSQRPSGARDAPATPNITVCVPPADRRALDDLAWPQRADTVADRHARLGRRPQRGWLRARLELLRRRQPERRS